MSLHLWDARLSQSNLSLCAASREKRKRRHEREKRAKYQRRIDLKMVDPNDVLETPEEAGLFSMKRINTDDTLKEMEDGTRQADELYDSDRVSSESEVEEESDSELDNEDLSVEDRRRIMTEREMDSLYTQYLTRTGQIKKRERKGKKAKRASETDGIIADGEIIEGSFVPDMTRDPLIDSDDDEGDDEGGHPLIDTLADSDEDVAGEAEKADKKAAMLWFDQPIFKELNWRAEGSSAAVEGSAEEKSRSVPKAQGPKAQGPAPMPSVGTKRKLGDDQEDDTRTRAQKKDEEGFEEVKADSDSDSDNDDSEDENDVAELAALGSLLKRKKLRKEDLIDACYHR